MKTLSHEEQKLLETLRNRFLNNPSRHSGIVWEDVAQRIQTSPTKINILLNMEKTGGEPDVIGYDNQRDSFLVCDCSAESPKGRRSVCYDRKALDARKEFKPNHAALEMAGEIGIELLTVEQYHQLQQLGTFDAKTSSWLKTPETIRSRGGALFGDFRYNTVFIYHNGASSYYAARGFRGIIYI
jgi:hypothetical protein